MKTFSRRHVLGGLLLGTTALTLPSVAFATSPAPSFVSPDADSVDVATGRPWLKVEEGGIGSGPGRVEMDRIWAESAGWQDNWSGGLYRATNAGVTKMYMQFAGMSATFSGSGTSWTSDNADGATLVVNGSGNYVYTAHDGTQITFDTSFNGTTDYVSQLNNCPGADPQTCQSPISITKPNGLKFTLSWQGLVMRVYDPENGDDNYYYQRLIGVSSSAGYQMTINYPDKLYGIQPVGSTTTPPSDWYNRSGVTFTNTVNPPTTLPAVTYVFGTDPNTGANTTKVTDPAGRAWVFENDPTTNNLTGIIRPGSSSPNINVSYSYGTDGTVSSATKDGVKTTYALSGSTDIVTDPLNNKVQVTSDANGRPTSYIDANGDETDYTYDSYERLTQVTHPQHNTEQYVYDGRGNVTQLTKSGGGISLVAKATYDTTCSNAVKCNEPNSTTDPNGSITNYTYDPTHGGVTIVDPPSPAAGIQPETRYSYTQVTSASGDLVYMPTAIAQCPSGANSCVAASEVSTKTAYHSNLLPASITNGNTLGTLAATSAMTYDSYGNLATLDGPLSGTSDTTNYRYDADAEVVGVTSSSPGNGQPDRAVKIAYRADGQVSEEELGTVASQSDADWANFVALQTLDVGFDSNSRPITSTLSSGGTPYALTQTDYDALGRVNCTAVRMNPSGTLPSSACTQMGGNLDQITQVEYDPASEVTDQIAGVGVSGQTATERHLTYNPNGTIASLTDANGNVTTYAYDGVDRLITTTYPDATTDQVTSYDSNGNVRASTNRAAQTTSFTYDVLNRTLTKAPAGEATITYGWDNLGRLTSASQTGTSLSFTYDALNDNLTQVGPRGTVTSTYDLAGRRTSIAYPGSPSLTISYNYLTTGEVSSITDGSTSLASYTYDALGNRTQVSFGNGTSESYSLDPVSRLTTLSLTGLPSADELTIGGSTSPISYNAASQILSATRSDAAGANTYSFTNYAAVTRSNMINTLNQVTRTSSTIGGPTSFNYDPKGNLDQSGSTYFCYDAENHLTASGTTSTCASPTASLAYDPLGRLQSVTASSTTNFAYDGVNMLAEYKGSVLMDRYVFGQNMDEPIVAYDSSGNRSWLYSDERGSIVGSAGSAPTNGMLYTNTYDEYGAPPLDSSGNDLNAGRFQYTGQMWLPEVGVYYYKARLYSPTMGRFMQTDPIGYGDLANMYAYAHNDPINGADPLGLDDVTVGIDPSDSGPPSVPPDPDFGWCTIFGCIWTPPSDTDPQGSVSVIGTPSETFLEYYDYLGGLTYLGAAYGGVGTPSAVVPPFPIVTAGIPIQKPGTCASVTPTADRIAKVLDAAGTGLSIGAALTSETVVGGLSFGALALAAKGGAGLADLYSAVENARAGNTADVLSTAASGLAGFIGGEPALMFEKAAIARGVTLAVGHRGVAIMAEVAGSTAGQVAGAAVCP